MRLRSIVVPTYNEERNVGVAIKALLELEDVEVIISDDGSNDKTLEIARRYSKEHDNLQVVENKHRGKGSALRSGFNSGRGEVLGFLDADLSAKPRELNRLFELIKKGDVDLAVGSRELPESTIPIYQPLHRRFLGLIYSRIARILFGVKVRDFQCGCKAFKRELWGSINMRSDGFVFDTELIARAQAKGFRIQEVPITWSNDRISRVHPVKDPLNMFIGLLSIKWMLMRGG
jgi:glycosyltransferase involved in cell wall biosynthesis